MTVGSSPLTRGKHGRRIAQFRVHRLIPAHAGKTSWPSKAILNPAAHPRSRGENGDAGGWSARPPGSSPLTRGKPHDLGRHVRDTRLIPAHAGKTFLSRFVPFLPRAHPRSRGENCTQFSVHLRGRGSSPLTRGKHSRRRAQLFDCGLIPAHAGKTVGELGGVVPGGLIPAHAGKTHTRPSRAYPSAAHPRSRGENLMSALVSIR